jgi:hypothetical protein
MIDLGGRGVRARYERLRAPMRSISSNRAKALIRHVLHLDDDQPEQPVGGLSAAAARPRGET